MRAPFRFMLLLVCFAVTRAESQTSRQEPSRQRAAAESQARVTGRVLLADAHTPARNAMILLTSLDGQNRQFQRVGLDGTYLFEHVVPGEYIVVAYLEGYLSAFDKLIPTAADNTLGSLFEKIVAAQGSVRVGVQGTQTYDISMERGAIVSGRVLYSDGVPAVQVDIELQDTAGPNSSPETRSVQMGDIARSEFVHRTMETDDEGRFRIAGVRPGVYRIAAVQLQKIPMSAYEPMMRYVLGALRFYSDDTVHPAAAKTYTLTAGGEVTDITIRIPLDGLHSVQGKVAAKDGRPITMVGLEIVETSDPSIYFSTNASEGVFHVDRLPPGTYKVTAPYGYIIDAAGETTAAFGNGATSFTLKDTDLTGVLLTLPAGTIPQQLH
jgi:protocatechuate 3,4-dioxygenase beta subunit